MYLRNWFSHPFSLFFHIFNSPSRHNALLGEIITHCSEFCFLFLFDLLVFRTVYLNRNQHLYYLGHFWSPLVLQSRQLPQKIVPLPQGFPRVFLPNVWHHFLFPASMCYSLQILLLAFCKWLSSHRLNRCPLVSFTMFLHPFWKFCFPCINKLNVTICSCLWLGTTDAIS